MKALLALLLLLGLGAYFALRTETSEPAAVAELPVAPEDKEEPHAVLGAVDGLQSEAREGVGESAEAAAQMTQAMTVHVTVTRSLARNAEAVPGVECEIGLGIGVPSWRGPPPAERVLLARDTSSSTGEIAFEIDIPEAWFEREGAGVVWARLVTPGWKRRHFASLIPRDGSTELTVQVLAREGATLRGVVSLPNGKLATGCYVRLLEDDVKNGGYKEESGTRTNRNGEFALHFDRTGTYHLLAKHDGVGTASARNLMFDVDDPAVDLSLTLVGSGEISGRVVDPDGAPIRQYRIWACPADMPDRRVGYFQEHQQVPFELEGLGLYDDKIDTDDEGRFHFRGLRAGKYIIRGKTGSTGDYAHVLTLAPVETGTHDIVLEIEQYTLVVLVLDHAGERIAPKLKHYPERTAEPHAVFCLISDSGGRIMNRNQYPPVGRSRTDRGDVLFEVEPARSYAFGVISAREPLHEEFVTIMSGQWQTVCTIKLRKPDPFGTLNVVLETPGGEPMTDHSQIVILGPITGIPVAESGKDFDDPQFEVALAAGSYAVEIDAEPPRGYHGERLEAKMYARVETTTDIRPGARTDLIVPLGKGGNIELTLTLEGLPDDTRWPTAGGISDVDAEARDAKRGARVLLTSVSEGKPIAPQFKVWVPGMRFYGATESNWIAPDTTEASPTLLRVGEYVLLLQAKGYPPHEERITIEHGMVTRVAVLLKAE